MTDRQAPDSGDADAVRVAVDPDTEHVRDAVTDPTFSRYLQRVHEGSVVVGDTWTEFVNDGCGSQTSVSFRVVAVEGGTRVGPGTDLELD
ncbi:hypothetical protein [Halobacterium wangiae]|uniref:hypothetical protein n=1 Tax=Halobacterium wangiae TaxID=2902623 RepID=UPI001E3C258A|nr:hypothetical protein [Halobacterium wangiae]